MGTNALEASWNFLWNLVQDWPYGTVGGVLIALAMLGVLGIAGCGLYVAFDCWFLPQHATEGRVAGLAYEAPRLVPMTMYDAATKTNSVHIIHHEASWTVYVEFDDCEGSIEVSKSFYARLRRGDPLRVWYVIGRLSGRKYLQSLAERRE